MLLRRFTLACLMFCFGFLHAQNTERKSGEILIQLTEGTSLEAFQAKLQSIPYIAYGEPVAVSWKMHTLRFNETPGNADEILTLVRQMPEVQLAQFNFKVEYRDTEPNDPEFWRQDNLRLINATDAWDASTGGLTPFGDTIVVAVLEKGAMQDHDDLAGNWWHNWAEIPNNNIDDDGNGVIDDFLGFDAVTRGNWEPNITTHGTTVNGIIGASGDNSYGISGVNWNVKLMNVSNAEFVTDIVAGYEYVANMRRLYNTSNKQKGAFVVVANASFGIDNADADDYPVWCAVYNELGEVGIVSVCATANRNVNVDVVGDMPTTCPSNYIIAVTNVDQFDNKVTNAAFGAMHIDIGAPGQNIYSTRVDFSTSPPSSALGNAGTGTSYATPHVSGVVAWIYSLSCTEFGKDAISNPSQTALEARNAVLQSAAANNSLQGITTTGGRLDMDAAKEAVFEYCGVRTGPLKVLDVRGNFGRGPLQLTYQTPSLEPYTCRVFNALGQLMDESKITPSQTEPNILQYRYEHFPAGMYLITIGRGNDMVTEKFLKI